MDRIRVLFVAPVARDLPRLAWHDELAGLAEIENADVALIAGDAATLNNVSKRLTRERWDVIVFSGHGWKNRLRLTDGRDVSGEWIATQCKAAAPEAVIVGACMSDQRDESLRSIGESIANAGMHAITFAVSVDDAAGAVYSTEFVRAMAAVFDVSRADRVASEMCAQVNADTAEGVRLHRAAVNGWRQFKRQLDQMQCDMTEVLTRLARVEQKVEAR